MSKEFPSASKEFSSAPEPLSQETIPDTIPEVDDDRSRRYAEAKLKMEEARKRQADAESMMTPVMEDLSNRREEIREDIEYHFSEKTLGEFEENFNIKEMGMTTEYSFTVAGHKFDLYDLAVQGEPGILEGNYKLNIDGVDILDSDRVLEVVRKWKPLIKALIRQRRVNESSEFRLKDEREQMLVDEVLAIK